MLGNVIQAGAMAKNNQFISIFRSLGTRYGFYHAGIFTLQVLGLSLVFIPILCANDTDYHELRELGAVLAFGSMILGVAFTVLLEFRRRTRRFFLIVHLMFLVFVLTFVMLSATVSVQ